MAQERPRPEDADRSLAAASGREAERILSDAPQQRVTLVGRDRVRIEFRIEDLMSQLIGKAPPQITVASCAGCRGCAA